MGNEQGNEQGNDNQPQSIVLERSNCIRLNLPIQLGNIEIVNPTTLTPDNDLSPITPQHSLPSTYPDLPTKFSERIISDSIAKMVAKFWRENIESCSMQDRLEIACNIWIGMLSKNNEIRRLGIAKFKNNLQMETNALKMLDMIGYIVRAQYTDNDLSSVLSKLGAVHNKMGIKPIYYQVMLNQVTETLQYYFPVKYTNTIEFALCEIFTCATMYMTGKDLKIPNKLDNISFLCSLRCCISHEMGKEYLFRFLHQKYCDEIVVFLCLLNLFKTTIKSKEKYKILKQIAKECLAADGSFAVNISYELRKRTVAEIDSFLYFDSDFSIDNDFFVDIEDEVCRLIMQSHWKPFKNKITQIYNLNQKTN
eukprot:513567_1